MNQYEASGELTKDSALKLAINVIRALEGDYDIVIEILEDALKLENEQS